MAAGSAVITHLIDLHTYLLFLGAAIVLVLVPGPDMAYMLTRTIVQGRRAGIVAAIGINAGAYVHLTAAVAGLSALLLTSSIAFSIVKWLGAVYLIWIGVQALRSKHETASLTDGSSKVFSTRAIFWQGFWSDVLNPKVAMFFVAFLPQFVNVSTGHETQQLLLLSVTANVVAVVLNIVIVCCASVVTQRLRANARFSSWMTRVMGAMFVALGLRLANEKL